MKKLELSVRSRVHGTGWPTIQELGAREDAAATHWNPRIVGELNGQHVKVVKFQGEFIWHEHAEEDELFLVLKGSFRMEFRDKNVTLSEGDFIVVPRGREHRPDLRIVPRLGRR